jgi:hypothetical protein
MEDDSSWEGTVENSNSATTRDLEGAALRLKEPGVIGPTVSHQDAIGPVVGPLADRGDDGASLRLHEPARGSDPVGPS